MTSYLNRDRAPQILGLVSGVRLRFGNSETLVRSSHGDCGGHDDCSSGFVARSNCDGFRDDDSSGSVHLDDVRA